MSPKLKSNIPILFIIKFCKWLMLYMPIVKLYYVENNLNDYHLFLLHGIYSGIIFFSEIPSGYLADRWGRKRTMQTGLFLGIIGFSTYAATSGLWGFIIAEVALGFGEAFISGSDTALLYDTLLTQKRQGKYLKFEGLIAGTGNVSEALAGILVTVIAFTNMRNYYVMQTALITLAFIASFIIVEPTIHKLTEKVSLKEILKVVRYTLFENKILSRYILFSSVVGFASLSMAWFAQSFIYQTGIPYKQYGIIWTALNLMVALGSFSAYRIDKLFGTKSSLFYILVFLAGGYMLASQTIAPYGIACLLVFYFVRGTAHPILKSRINHHTPSNVRATVLSVRSLLIRLLFALSAPALGVAIERISLEFALLMAGIIILVTGGITLILILTGKTRLS